MMLVFVDEIGHKYADILNVDTYGDGDREGDNTFLFAICSQVKRCLCVKVELNWRATVKFWVLL